MCSKNPLASRISKATGFVLLEVLVAMSLIVGVWMSSLGAYQRLVLHKTQTENKRAQLRRELDTFEMGFQARGVIHTKNLKVKGLNESSRVPSRNRAQHATSQSAIKNQR
ncbi:hypothetical protein IEN92_04900 [Polynucleobacter sp. MWH-Creno-3A4]|uniref:type IV pilus modification PilV family protein n=1 Tax=Polynucleobacter sp. MWH-Creno-3A4 TaxID=1855886 RepID=UPI001C0D04AF|nr:hypothetical protein [Polynucleobacter sp. MWH-Creno-3A4]MBU3606086.1 hypothetical protein [Polynucleobacter sp. MWH-Creno-3A4]